MARACGSYPQCRGFESPSRYDKKERAFSSLFFCRISMVDSARHCGAVLRAHEVRWTSALRRPRTTLGGPRPNPPLAFLSPFFFFLFSLFFLFPVPLFPLFPLFPFSPFPLFPFPPFPLSPFPFPRLFSFLDAFALNPATFVTKSRIFPCLVTQFLLLRSGNFGDL